MLTQRSGGWPLTMFLTHEDQRPFFGGTYFPKEARYGLPAFKDLLLRVARVLPRHRAELRAAERGADGGLRASSTPPPAAATRNFTDAPLRAVARSSSERDLRSAHGGFGGAPKFPQPQMLRAPAARLARERATPREPDLQALYMATLTLRRMADGGINDQLGGGFCRYSVDETWMIPHFEKMLYDNAGLLAVYAQAALATGDAEYARVAAETADWMLREMQSAEGGYYSSLDADSEGHEGKFYVWDREEVRAALTGRTGVRRVRAALRTRPRRRTSRASWHLYVASSLEEHRRSSRHCRAAEARGAARSGARQAAGGARACACRPARDDKVLTSWNALMIRGMAIAARALERRRPRRSAATRALDFIRARCGAMAACWPPTWTAART